MKSWIVWILLSIFYSFQFIQRIISNIALDSIISKFNINATDIGYFAGMYYLGYVISHIPLSFIFNLYSPAKIISICILFISMGLTPLLYSTDFNLVILGRFLIGIGSSASTVGAFKLLPLFFGNRKFPYVFSLMITLGLTIIIISNTFFIKIIQSFNLNFLFQCMLIFSLFLSSCFYFFLPTIKIINNKTQFYLYKINFSHSYNKTIFFISFLGGLMVAPLEGFADAWSNLYLKTLYGLSDIQSSYMTRIIYIGMSFGLVFMGFITEKIHLDYLILTLSSFSMIICFILLSFKLPLIYISIIFFIIGFFCSYQIIIISKINYLSINHPNKTFFSSLSNMIMMSFGYISHRSIGFIISYFWNGHKNEYGMPIYDSYIFNYVLLFIISCLFISFYSFFIFFLKEKLTKKSN